MMKIIRPLHLTASLLTLFTSLVGATTYYVAPSGNDTTGTSWASAKTTIQAAIDLSSAGDTVIVSNGVYAVGSRAVSGYTLPNRVLIDKAITVESVNGPDVTIIEGVGPIGITAVRCAYVGSNATLSGFTLTNGAARATGSPYFEERGAGGAYCAASAVLTNCILTGNSSASGGAVVSGTLNDCTLTGNWTANWGGAARSSILNNCILSNNGAGKQGGGVYQGTLNHCTLTNNWAIDDGGGAAFAELNDCMLIGNTAEQGGGAYNSTLNHSTLSGNQADNFGGGASACTLNNCVLVNNTAVYDGGGANGGTLNNCTVSGNAADTGGGVNGAALNNSIVYLNTATTQGANYDSSTFTNTCSTPLPAGSGNIDSNPAFVGANDFHLQLGSPCINTGNGSVSGAVDLDGHARIVGGMVDMGAYESAEVIVTVETIGGTTTGSGNYLPGESIGISVLADNAHFTFTSWNDGNTDLSRTITVPSNSVTYTASFSENTGAVTTYVAVANSNPVWPYISWATAATNIQDGIDAVINGDSVIVSNGVYASGSRTVDGYSLSTRVVVDKAITVQSLNGPDVTIIEGAGPVGNAAVRCVYLDYNATLSGFSLTNGATRYSGDTRRDRSGGGVYCEYTAVVTNCTLVGNRANYYGGGSYEGTLNNCTLTGNQAVNSGGGAYDSDLNHCTLMGNEANSGGGAYRGTLENCLITGNTADYNGGGAYDARLYSCTVTDNSADSRGGGIYDSDLYNCIVYFNTVGSSSYANHYSSYFTDSCTMPYAGGSGNITNAPVFAATNDFHLASGSPGINAGNNSYINSSIDLAGNARITGSVVDMGAYESPAVIVTIAGTDGTGVGSGLYFPGESISVSAQGSTAHYSLTSWSDGDTNRVRTITVPTSNSTFTASFVENIADSLTAYVAVSNATPVWPYATWATAATTIQDAVDAMGDGYDDMVIVSNGVYATGGRPAQFSSLTNRVMIDKDITVQSVNGSDVTLIEGAGPIGDSAVRCVYLDNNATLSGFTLTNGATRYNGYSSESMGGGVYCEYNAVVTNCTLTGNRAYENGGGAYQCYLYHCILTDNYAGRYGGGAYQGTLYNCVVIDNQANYDGGGAASASLYHCTVTGNSDGVDECSVYNSIVYFNSGSYNNHDYSSSFYASCTTPLPSGGSGNTANPPMFVATDDFRLMASSPCIDEGYNNYANQINTDLDGNPRMMSGQVDMGAYESPYVGVRVVNADGTSMGGGNFLPGTSNVLISAVATDSHAFFSAWNDGDTSMPRTIVVSSNKVTYTAIFTQYVGSVTAYVSLDSPNPAPPFRTWDTAANNIQDAIDALLDGDVVIVSNGVYAAGSRTANGAALPNRVAITKALTVQSLNGPDVTVIEGAGPIGPAAVRCAYVGLNATLSGFTLTNGASHATGDFFPEMSAGGAYCEASAVVTNCTITYNTASTGGGVYGGTLNDCILTDNGALQWGGGARDSTLNHCDLMDNFAELQGGGAWGGILNHCTLILNGAFNEGGGAAFAELNDCAITNNYADLDGGGVYESVLNHCTLSGNSAESGGGAHGSTLNHCSLTGNTGYNNGGGAAFGTLNNCLLNGNSSFAGGGARGSTLNNCTVANNFAEYRGGGTYQGILKNCIVYHNDANWDSEDPAADPYANRFEGSFSFSCTFPHPGGTGNITVAPQFVGANDLSLQLGSPCIDTGSNAYTNSLTDLDGFSRIVDGTVDMGAYEYQSIIIASSPPVLTGLTALGDGAFQFGFTNRIGASFTVYGTTNLAMPLVDWTNLGPVAEIPVGSGQFLFTDPATNHPNRYYQVLSP